MNKQTASMRTVNYSVSKSRIDDERFERQLLKPGGILVEQIMSICFGGDTTDVPKGVHASMRIKFNGFCQFRL